MVPCGRRCPRRGSIEGKSPWCALPCALPFALPFTLPTALPFTLPTALPFILPVALPIALAPIPALSNQVHGLRRSWKGLTLPWRDQQRQAVSAVPIGSGETLALAPLGIFGHLKSGGTAELLGTAVLHLASRPGFPAKRRYLESKGLWQSDHSFGNATMPPEDVRAEAVRGAAHFDATFLEMRARPKPAPSAHDARKPERGRRGTEGIKGPKGPRDLEASREKLREKRALQARSAKRGRSDEAAAREGGATSGSSSDI